MASANHNSHVLLKIRGGAVLACLQLCSVRPRQLRLCSHATFIQHIAAEQSPAVAGRCIDRLRLCRQHSACTQHSLLDIVLLAAPRQSSLSGLQGTNDRLSYSDCNELLELIKDGEVSPFVPS